MAKETIERFIHLASVRFERLRSIAEDKRELGTVPSAPSGTGWVIYHPANIETSLFVPTPDTTTTHTGSWTITFGDENTLISVDVEKRKFRKPRIHLTILGELTQASPVNPILQQCILGDKNKGLVTFHNIRTEEKRVVQLQPAPYEGRFTMAHGTLIDRARLIQGERLSS